MLLKMRSKKLMLIDIYGLFLFVTSLNWDQIFLWLHENYSYKKYYYWEVFTVVLCIMI